MQYFLKEPKKTVSAILMILMILMISELEEAIKKTIKDKKETEFKDLERQFQDVLEVSFIFLLKYVCS